MSLVLRMSLGDGRARTFPITHFPCVIGRGHSCDLRLSLPSVATRHCEILPDGSKPLIRRLSHDAILCLNGESIYDHRLREGDRLQIGTVELVVESATANAHSDKSPAALVESLPTAFPKRESTSREPKDLSRAANLD